MRRHVPDALGLDAPPEVVKKLEQRIDRFGELLVEAPLVLVVVPSHPLRQPLDRAAQGLGKLDRGPLGRVPRIEAILDAEAHTSQEVGERLRVRQPRRFGLWIRAHLATLASRSTRSPGWSGGPMRRPRLLAAKSRTASAAPNRGW